MKQMQVMELSKAMELFGKPIQTSMEETKELGIRYRGANRETHVTTLLSEEGENGEEVRYMIPGYLVGLGYYRFEKPVPENLKIIIKRDQLN